MNPTRRVVVVLVVLSLTGCSAFYRSTAREVQFREGKSWDNYCWSRNSDPEQWDDPANCRDSDAQPELMACANQLAMERWIASKQDIRSELKICMRQKGWFLNLYGQTLY
jgi:hypothetical protein